MADHFKALTEKHIRFIEQQKVFFIGSASVAEVNVSPKGLDSLRVVSSTELLFLDFPGSGNRTARDVREGGRFTLMFNAFEGAPLIMRLFCQADLVETTDAAFGDAAKHFAGVPVEHIRRFIRFRVQVIETSCGYGVPILKFEKERTQMTDWTKRKIEQNKLQDYIDEHDQPIDLNSL